MPDQPIDYEQVTEVSTEPWVPLPKKEWTEPERWVWEQVRTGQLADFNQRHGKGLDPNIESLWVGKEKERRTLRPDFLRTILLCEPWRSLITHEGCVIVGAYFDEPVNLSFAEISCVLGVFKSRLAAGMLCRDTRFQYSLSLQASFCQPSLAMDSAEIKGDLFMRQGSFTSARLPGVTVGGALDMEGARFGGELAMDRAEIKGNLFMRQGSFASTRLHGVKVGGQLDMEGARFSGELAMDRAEIKGDLFMRQGSFESARLLGVQVDGQLDMDGAGFQGMLDCEGMQVASHLLMAGTRFFKEVNLSFCRVGAGLSLRGAHLGQVDLSQGSITGTLVLSYPDQEKAISWYKGSLDLRHTTAGAVLDGQEDWPASLRLDGFSYAGIGSRETIKVPDELLEALEEYFEHLVPDLKKIKNPEEKKKLIEEAKRFAKKQKAFTTASDRPASWYVAWLEKQKGFSMDPYQRCARFLRESGQPDKANEVMYAGLERERKHLKKRSLPRLGRALLKWTIGYGLGYRYFAALLWAVLFLGMGAVVCGAGGGNSHGALFCLGFSLDNMLPLIDLRPEHEAMSMALVGFAKFYFLFIQQLVGWVLVLCVAAGLAGVGKPGGRD